MNYDLPNNTQNEKGLIAKGGEFALAKLVANYNKRFHRIAFNLTKYKVIAKKEWGEHVLLSKFRFTRYTEGMRI